MAPSPVSEPMVSLLLDRVMTPLAVLTVTALASGMADPPVRVMAPLSELGGAAIGVGARQRQRAACRLDDAAASTRDVGGNYQRRVGVLDCPACWLRPAPARRRRCPRSSPSWRPVDSRILSPAPSVATLPVRVRVVPSSSAVEIDAVRRRLRHASRQRLAQAEAVGGVAVAVVVVWSTVMVVLVPPRRRSRWWCRRSSVKRILASP